MNMRLGLFPKYQFWLGLILVGVAFFAGFALASHLQATSSPTHQADKYPLVARRTFTNNPNDALINFGPLRQALHQRFDSLSQAYSVYFEYLPTGTSIGLNSTSQMIAASLVKLPLVMNLHHAAELGKVKLGDTITLTQADLDPNFGNLYRKGAGTKLTYNQAAKLAIEQSDNTAARAISRNLDGKLGMDQESLPWLDLDYEISGGEAVISARGYASILKCLYFSCYLTPSNSETILTYLTNTPFNNRLTKYIPKSVKVAHKIGVFNPENVQSDCGIFYVPQRPYVLCVMDNEADPKASQLIADTSKQVYNFVTSLKN